MLFRWIDKQPRLGGSWFILLTQQSMGGGDEHGKSGHLYIFTHLVKALNDAF